MASDNGRDYAKYLSGLVASSKFQEDRHHSNHPERSQRPHDRHIWPTAGPTHLPYTFIRHTTSGTETRRNMPLPLLLQALGRRDNFPTLRPRQYDVLPLPRLMCGYHAIPQPSLRSRNEHLASSLHTAIETYGIVTDLVYGQIYAHKVDGYGPRTIHRPPSRRPSSATSAPQAPSTRTPVVNSVGGPHDMLGYG